MLFIVEITRDNNGSLSDSSFDVESEENFDRRRGQAQAGHSPSSGPSRPASSPHQHRRDAGGRTSARHGPPPASYGVRHQQQQHDPRRHHRSAVEPDAALNRRSTTAPGSGPGDYRTSRGHGGSHGGHSGHSGAGVAAKVDTYAQQQSKLFVALFDYDPQTMSPNQNATTDELPFTEGQILKVRDMYGM